MFSRLALSSSVVLGMAVSWGCGEVNSDSADARPTADAAEVGPDADVPDASPPADAKTCQPNTTTCANGQVEVCGEGGTVVDVEVCALGCAPQGARCYQITPSNGLAPYLDQAVGMNAVSITTGATVNTDTGEILDASGTRIDVVSATVQQVGEDAIRVFMAGEFSLGSMRVTGRNAVAFVAPGVIDVNGVVDVSGDRNLAGPGAGTCSSGRGGNTEIPGHWERRRAGDPAECAPQPGYIWVTHGSGGGGYATAGGAGGGSGGLGGVAGDGAAESTLVPLRGGCPGGGWEPDAEGGAGGAIQLVSAVRIRVASGGAPAVLHAGGGGGKGGASLCVAEASATSGGGGSGGGVLVEAPSVVIAGVDAGIVASGGAGGSGCIPGDSEGASPSGEISLAPICPTGSFGSAGGAGANVAPAGNSESGRGVSGGGGGGLGRIRINTFDGAYQAGPGAILRGVVTTGTVGIR
jgi:hypothetical protein